MFIYAIRNKTNGKVYIGKTERSLNRRWKQHLCEANRGMGFRLHRAIRKYGADAFTVSLLSTAATRDQLKELERDFIVKYCSINPNLGYNLTDGGDGLGGFKHSTETRQRMRVAKLGKPRSDDFRLKMHQIMLGRKLSVEHIRHISESHKGKSRAPFTLEHRDHMSQAQRGKRLSDETKHRIAQTLSGRQRSDDIKLKIKLNHPLHKSVTAPEGMAWCPDHQQYLSVSLFYHNKRNVTGVQGYCKECFNARYS